MDLVDAAAFAEATRAPAALDALAGAAAGGAVVVDARAGAPPVDPAALGALPVVVIALVADEQEQRGRGLWPWADVVVGGVGEAGRVVAAVEAHPLAATALVLHLRASAGLDVEAALVGESATYSLLQAGPEHRRWLAARPAPRPRRDDRGDERVTVRAEGATVRITLARPGVRNAVDAAMQRALTDALLAAAEAPGVDVVIDGEGPSFSSGGDLAEFGSLADPASAHLVRLARSPGRALARLAGRTTVVVHGACHGAGVELPAFAGRVVARPGTTFTLPEVAMGLVPGAGGTVSLPRRIGRQRTAWLALTGVPLDVPTALAWGLVDAVDEGPC